MKVFFLLDSLGGGGGVWGICLQELLEHKSLTDTQTQRVQLEPSLTDILLKWAKWVRE